MNTIPKFIKDKRLPKEVLDYIQLRIEQADEKGIKVDFRKGRNIKLGGSLFTGCFDEFNITVATGRPWKIWFPIFIHETCHFDQWAEKAPVWKNLEYKKTDLNTLLEKQLKRKNPDRRLLWKCLTGIRDMELDCELRTIKEIKKYKLPVDIDEYTRSVNVYMYWHMVVYALGRYHKSEYSKNTIKLRKELPCTIQKDYNLMPMHYIDIYLKYGF